MSFELYHGDCVQVMASWPEACVDAICADPPYGLAFMGKHWDDLGDAGGQIDWHMAWAEQALRVLKPGGFLLAFSGSKTSHYLTLAVELVGFEIRDSIDWLYFNGFPKSMNVGEGRGTALKPAKEPIVMARKRPVGTVEENLAAHGTGALNIEKCSIEVLDSRYAQNFSPNVGDRSLGVTSFQAGRGTEPGSGRWPSNVIIDGIVAAELDARCGAAGARAAVSGDEPSAASVGRVTNARKRVKGVFHRDTGGPSRFFHVPKPSTAEREFGCDGLPLKSAGEVTDREDGTAGLNSPRAGAGRLNGSRNHHPTLKPINLMRYLCRLITPPGGLVLDCFAGSGTTGIAALREGFRFVGIERELQYLAIAAARVGAAAQEGVYREESEATDADVSHPDPAPGQPSGGAGGEARDAAREASPSSSSSSPAPAIGTDGCG